MSIGRDTMVLWDIQEPCCGTLMLALSSLRNAQAQPALQALSLEKRPSVSCSGGTKWEAGQHIAHHNVQLRGAVWLFCGRKHLASISHHQDLRQNPGSGNAGFIGLDSILHHYTLQRERLGRCHQAACLWLQDRAHVAKGLKVLDALNRGLCSLGTTLPGSLGKRTWLGQIMEDPALCGQVVDAACEKK